MCRTHHHLRTTAQPATARRLNLNHRLSLSSILIPLHTRCQVQMPTFLLGLLSTRRNQLSHQHMFLRLCRVWQLVHLLPSLHIFLLRSQVTLHRCRRQIPHMLPQDSLDLTLLHLDTAEPLCPQRLVSKGHIPRMEHRRHLLLRLSLRRIRHPFLMLSRRLQRTESQPPLLH